MVTVIIQRDGEDVFIELHKVDPTVPVGPDCEWKDIAAFLPNGTQVELTPDETATAISLANAGVDYTGTDE